MALLLVSMTVVGCGGAAGASRAPTSTPRPATATATSVSDFATTLPVDTVTPGASPTATATPRASTTATAAATGTPVPAGPPVLVYASLGPDNVQPGGAISANVQTRGTILRVEVYLGSGSPTGPAPTTLSLARTAPGTWTASGAAPAAPGQYHFTVGLYNAAGRRLLVDNDNWNLTVGGATTGGPGGVAQPLPADIPLAPGFNWSNPVAATFQALGKTVNGSSVASNARPDIAPSTVATFYETRLPRAGWNVDQSTLPGAGATSFSIFATSGARVCVVEYGGGAIRILYGTP